MLRYLQLSGKYSKVRSSRGNIGYVKTNKLSEIQVTREKMEEEKISNVNILSEYATISSNYEVLNDVQEKSIVLPNLFDVREADDKYTVKNIIDLSGSKFEAYKKWAEDSNINICPTITLSTSVNKLCSTYLSRSYIINTLYNTLISNKLSMICVDFAEVDDAEGFYRFIIEMVPRYKAAGIKVLVKNNTNLNISRLNNIADYVF